MKVWIITEDLVKGNSRKRISLTKPTESEKFTEAEVEEKDLGLYEIVSSSRILLKG
jgi:hypothetical protein